MADNASVPLRSVTTAVMALTRVGFFSTQFDIAITTSASLLASHSSAGARAVITFAASRSVAAASLPRDSVNSTNALRSASLGAYFFRLAR